MDQKSKEEGTTELPTPKEQPTDDTIKETPAPSSSTSKKSVGKGKSPKAGKSDSTNFFHLTLL